MRTKKLITLVLICITLTGFAGCQSSAKEPVKATKPVIVEKKGQVMRIGTPTVINGVTFRPTSSSSLDKYGKIVPDDNKKVYCVTLKAVNTTSATVKVGNIITFSTTDKFNAKMVKAKTDIDPSDITVDPGKEVSIPLVYTGDRTDKLYLTLSGIAQQTDVQVAPTTPTTPVTKDTTGKVKTTSETDLKAQAPVTAKPATSQVTKVVYRLDIK